MIAYDFLAPEQILFGWGRRRELPTAMSRLGRRAWIVWGSQTVARAGLGREIVASLTAAGIEPVELAAIDREPEVDDVDRATEQLRGQVESNHDVLLAIGGGAAIDLAKAVAAMATNSVGASAIGASTAGASVKDFLEGVGRGRKIERPPLAVVALPTTAGTGSEATKNAVLSGYDPPFKKSLRADQMLPRLVIVDPELTVSLPPALTAQSGLDAITQLIESYISRRARPIPQALAIAGLKLAVPAITQAVRDGSARHAREDMAHAALLSGLALANSGLGLAHGVAAALGALARVSHGLACAVMLPVALRVNRPVSQPRYAEMARALGNLATDEAEAADWFVERITNLCAELGVPERLSTVGIERSQIAELVALSHGNSREGNPHTIDDSELTALLESML